MSRLLVVAAVFAVGCFKPGADTAKGVVEGSTVVAPPAAMFPPADWTHKELVEHLAKKGVALNVRPADASYAAAGIRVAALCEGEGAEQPLVVSYVCRDERAARDQAGTMGPGAFAAGRFAFGLSSSDREGIDDARLLRRISAALK